MEAAGFFGSRISFRHPPCLLTSDGAVTTAICSCLYLHFCISITRVFVVYVVECWQNQRSRWRYCLQFALFRLTRRRWGFWRGPIKCDVEYWTLWVVATSRLTSTATTCLPGMSHSLSLHFTMWNVFTVYKCVFLVMNLEYLHFCNACHLCYVQPFQ